MIITSYCYVIYMAIVLLRLVMTAVSIVSEPQYWGKDDTNWSTLISIIAGAFLVYGVHKGW